MTEQTYKLYAVKTNVITDDMLRGFDYSLIPIGRSYCLIYADKTLEKPFVEIPPETPLTEQERHFLTECKIKVNARYLQENATEYSEFLSDFCDSLEKELAEEKKKVGEKKNDK